MFYVTVLSPVYVITENVSFMADNQFHDFDFSYKLPVSSSYRININNMAQYILHGGNGE